MGAGAAIRGIQSKGIMVNAKHYIACDQDTQRSGVSANVDERTRMEMYAPAFHGATAAGAASVMCSYNKINNVHSCENAQTLNVELKGYTGFDGFVLSDWNAAHSTVASAQNGLDMEMPKGKYFGDTLLEAVANFSVTQDVVDDKVRRILLQMFKFGLFESGNGTCNDDIAAEAQERYLRNVTSPELNGLARELAAAGTVLLQNERETLPLDATSLSSLAVFGASADGPPVSSVCAEGGTAPCVEMNPHVDRYPRGVLSQGGGSGGVAAPYVVTPVEGLRARAGGMKVAWHNVSAEAAPTLATAADAAVVVVGTVSGEGMDRENLSLCEADNALIQAVIEAQPRTVVVVVTPGAVLLPWAKAAGAIVAMFMPGQEVGNALADIIFGDVNPSGRLPLTLPNKENETLTPAQWPGVAIDKQGKDLQANYSEKLEVGYRWYNAHSVVPAFPFGHGLSYTDFSYSGLTVDNRTVSFQVTNIGDLAGAEVAQLYLDFPAAAGEPPRQLKGFRKLRLKAGKARDVAFKLTDRDLSIWDTELHHWSLVHGDFALYVGASSADIRLTAKVTVGTHDMKVLVV